MRIRKRNPFTFRNIKNFILLITLIAVWVAVLFNPVYFAFHYSNPLWLFMYILVIPEILVAVLVSNILLELID